MNHNQSQGHKGEELALKHLLKIGYSLQARNWRFRHKEIDLIFKDQNELVITEVKARENDFYGRPEEFVSRQKQRFLIQAANAYASLINWHGEIRFDIIAITFKPEYRLEHFKGAFYA